MSSSTLNCLNPDLRTLIREPMSTLITRMVQYPVQGNPNNIQPFMAHSAYPFRELD